MEFLNYDTLTPIEKTMIMVLERIEKLEDVTITTSTKVDELYSNIDSFIRMANYRGIRATIRMDDKNEPSEMLKYILEDTTQDRIDTIYKKNFPTYIIPTIDEIKTYIFPESEIYTWDNIKKICLFDLSIYELNFL